MVAIEIRSNVVVRMCILICSNNFVVDRIWNIRWSKRIIFKKWMSEILKKIAHGNGNKIVSDYFISYINIYINF